MASWWRVDKHISRAVKSIFRHDSPNDLIIGESVSELRTGGIKCGDKLRVPNGSRLIVMQGVLTCKKNDVVIKIITPSRSLSDSNSIVNSNNEEVYVVNDSNQTAVYSIG